MTTGAIMILAYIGMLYHVKYRGNKNKWLLYMIGMLWISQVGVFLFGCAFDKLFVRLLWHGSRSLLSVFQRKPPGFS